MSKGRSVALLGCFGSQMMFGGMQMRRPDGPSLRIIVADCAHLNDQMA